MRPPGPETPLELARAALRPPISNWRFWVVQGLVLAIAAGHEFADAENSLGPTGVPSFATVSLFLVPIIYAALNFGITGSFSTAVWVTALTLPDFVFIDRAEHHWADGIQLAIIDAVAIFVGQRVERERLARTGAEQAGEAARKAEARYRALFATSPAPVLVTLPDGHVRECNPAAQTLLGKDLVGRTAADILGVGFEELARPDPRLIELQAAGGPRDVVVYGTTIETDDGPMVQLLLRDVTDERRERQLISAYAASVVRAQEEERRRIGQEIHDEPVQALTQLYRRLADLRARDGGAPAAELTSAEELLGQTIKDLRDLARGLRPPSLDDLGLVPTLRKMVQEFGDRNALQVAFNVEGQIRKLDPEQKLGLFRIVQEALHNIERHAAAQHVQVDMTYTDASVSAVVADDGIGFDVRETAKATSGMGLVGMRERVELLGGTLRIDSRENAGTTVRASLPVR